jgi:thiamine monophosphate synthase
MNEISNAAIAAIHLLEKENRSRQDFQDAAAQFKKAAEVCRRKAVACLMADCTGIPEELIYEPEHH